jgi:DNA polymerase, archaea type
MTEARKENAGALCGAWVDDDRKVHLSTVAPGGGRVESFAALQPFAWLSVPPTVLPAGVTVEELRGEGTFRHLAHANTLDAYSAFLKTMKQAGDLDVIRPLENQFLLQKRIRLFEELTFSELRRCQIAVRTAVSEGSASDVTRPEDRVLGIGLRQGGVHRVLLPDDATPAGEKALLETFNAVLRELDPDVIEGHNVFKADLDYLRLRCRLHKVPCSWGRFGQKAAFRSSRLKVAERWIDFPRCDLSGRAVVDTYLLVQLHDITARELTAYGLKDVAIAYGITPEEDPAVGNSAIIHAPNGAQIAPENLRALLEDDLRETEALADLLLPTYFEQTRTFPILLQEATLRGTTAKIDLLFLEEYYHARQSCPVPPEVQPFEGGYTKSFQEGVFRHVLHFDVASLYPSLLLQIGRAPKNDTLGIFIPLLKRLREYRLKFKILARAGATAGERAEAQARQTSFKILINSFYGYLGFSGARFGDGELAAEVTRRGRELLQALIDEFSKHGCTILEADTDGIYLSSESYFERPDALLALVAPVLPAGIELEFDGSFRTMWCYKAKNYALYDGEKITLRGSALRSRGIEPFLKHLSDRLIYFLLGATAESPLALVDDYRRRILAGTVAIGELAKSETLGQNPDAYERWIAEGGKPRRASAEAALQLVPRPRMGDRVSYYITAKAKGKTSDWQRARALASYDATAAGYDPVYYTDKLDDWLVRYGPFLGAKPAAASQGELSI